MPDSRLKSAGSRTVRVSVFSLISLNRFSILDGATELNWRQPLYDSLSITTYIIDDDEKLLSSLEQLFKAHGRTVRLFRSAEDFLSGLPYPRPACVLVDERLPGLQGRELLESLPKRGFDVPAILFSGYADTSLAVSAMKMGAINVLDKPLDEASVFAAIAEAQRIEIGQLQERSAFEKLKSTFASLNDVEHHVLKRIVEGASNKVIAFEQGVSLRTVELRRHRVFSKLGVDSLASLVQLYIRYTKAIDKFRSGQD